MAYKLLYRDLTETTKKCDFCPKYLTSLKAYVLKDDKTGEIFYAGPTCAKKNSIDDTLSGIPDLTKFTSTKEDCGTILASSNGSGNQGRGQPQSPDKKAIEYLILREEKLINDLKCSYSVLKNYFEALKKRDLTESEVSHINNIEQKAPDHLSLRSLQLTYNYLFWIDVALNKLPSEKSGFLLSIQATLRSKGSISENQKAAVNKWLENIDGVPQLR